MKMTDRKYRALNHICVITDIFLQITVYEDAFLNINFPLLNET